MKRLVPFLFISSLYAIDTQYLWIKENTDLKTGKCFEVDRETKGSHYLKQVDSKLCKPEHTIYVFHLKEGRCFEVDEKSEGERYFTNAKTELCRPKQTSYILGEFNQRSGCYEVDKETNGNLYYQLQKAELCESEHNLYTWEYKPLGNGQCYMVNPKTPQIKMKVAESNCKPNKPLHRFIKETPTKGLCLEEHPENSRLYSKKVDLKNCRPDKTLFVFYRQSNTLSGQCYEIDEETKGEKYVNQVRIEDCKER